MRSLLAPFALVTSAGLAQSPFYFSQPVMPKDLTAMATLIRTETDIQDIKIDEAHQSLDVHGPADKLLLADWLFHQLDRPPGQDQTGPAPEYRIGGPHNEMATIFRLPAAVAPADLTALVTAVRTVTDIQRVMPYERLNAIVARGEVENIAAAGWMVRQLWPADEKALTADSPAYPSPIFSREIDPVIRIFRMPPDTSRAALTSMVTAIRTVADVQRLFPYPHGNAIIGESSAAQIALAEWLVHEVGKAPGSPATLQTTLSGPEESAVRLFLLDPKKSPADVTALVTQIRSKAAIQRVMPLSEPPAVVLRGRPEQMPAVEELVAEYQAGAPAVAKQ